MDFIKSLLPPLRMPKLRKLKHWNGGSILNLNQLTSLASRSRHVGTVISSTSGSISRPAPVTVPSVGTTAKGHSRKRSEISTISATVKTTPSGNYGLYALKCDRSAAKRGILLSLPRRISTVGSSGSSFHSEVMVHEKFSPCKRNVIEPPPRRKRFRKRLQELEQHQQRQPPTIYLGDQMLERNRSELFRIAERGSKENLDRRQQPWLPPSARDIASGRRARSADNILTVQQQQQQGYAAGKESDSDEAEELPIRSWNGTRGFTRSGLKYSSSMESDLDDFGRVRKMTRGRLRLASDFSIDNGSEKIEVRYHANGGGGGGSTESEEITHMVPLPTRVTALRQEKVKPKSVPKSVKVERLITRKVEPIVSARDCEADFKPLAAVLQETVKSSDLKRKWFNEFLSESDEEPVKCKQSVLAEMHHQQHSSESLSKRFALVEKFDKQLEALERGRARFSSQDSMESVNIFKKPSADFDEFDTMFDGDRKPLESIRKNVTLNDQIVYINRKSNLRFSSSSFDSEGKPPVPSPPPPRSPPVDHLPTKSTVQIQDDKHLQRVRYVTSPSPSRSFDVDNNNLVLPLNVINSTDVGKCFTEQTEPPKMTMTTTTNQNGLGYYRTYNQSSNDHIPCNLNNNTQPNYSEPGTATIGSGTSSASDGSVFIVGETFKRATTEPNIQPETVPIRRYVNYKFDDFGHTDNDGSSSSDGKAVAPVEPLATLVEPLRTRPLRTFNIYDFHADCYNEEGVVII
ncbi:uncharacterized protein LOC131426487 [Malaya genurostris]|uniref:uncharacterized protein LOC131426487 n=1 Tax=Malaya genurostris TaxID=325434 RepID=UPI0026F3D266|nr:uncharacterized protein LOC131426487 [Malaya genurostris]